MLATEKIATALDVGHLLIQPHAYTSLLRHANTGRISKKPVGEAGEATRKIEPRRNI